MFSKRIDVVGLFAVLAAFIVAAVASLSEAGGDKKKGEKKKEVWSSQDDPTLPADFKFQGEYVRPNIGCQVIALGNGAFQAVLCDGGLPGAGWNGKGKHLMDGKLEGD